MKKIILSILYLLSMLNADEEIPTKQEVSKLYVATFNRAPDSEGLSYWTDSSHFTLSQIAQSFFDQEETQSIYPATTTDRDFIKSTYQNLFNRTPDSGGWEYWESYLDKNPNAKNLFILTLINGAKGDDATILEHKALVGVSFADASYDDLILSHSVMSGVTSDISTVEYIQEKIANHSISTDIWDNYTPSSIDSWYKPTIGTTWQWQIEGTLHTSYSVDLYDIDLFNSSSDEIQALQESGKRVICYFSAGSSEDWREDFYKFPANRMGNDLEGWEGEKWLDIRTQEIRDIMMARLDIAREKGCDGVEPDNVDAYTNSSGFGLTAEDQLIYNKFIADEAHKRGLSVALKNDPNQVRELVSYFDLAITEECHLYSECQSYLPFIEANKPVLNAEYDDKYVDDTTQRDTICQEARSLKIETLILPLGLDDEFRYSCSL